MQVIYSDGCSLMAGNEHTAWTMNTVSGYEECDTVWSAVIQKKYFPDAQLYSRATTACSNYSIARRTIKFVTKLLELHNPADILVCIMWTSMFRKEYRITAEQNSNKLRSNDQINFVTTLPTDNMVSLNQTPTGKVANNQDRIDYLTRNNLLELSDLYYRSNNHPINFAFHSMTQIEYVNLFLESKGIKSIQCYGFGDHFWYKKNNDFAVDFYTDEIAKRIEEYDIFYVNKHLKHGFYEWAKGAHKLGPGLHPLEGAHEMWANLLAKKYLTN